MEISKKQLDSLQDFFGDNEIDEEWLLRHIDIAFNDASKTVIISIDNMNEQEYGWLKEI